MEGGRIVSGQAPVVGGNAARARERALDDAIRQAVNQALATIVDPQTRAAQAKTLKTIEAKARSFVPRYRTLEEGEATGIYNIRLEAEVDEIALRRRMESVGTAAVPVPASPARAGPPGMLVPAGDKGEATRRSRPTCSRRWPRRTCARAPQMRVETNAASAAQAAARASLEQAALVTSDSRAKAWSGNRPVAVVLPRERPAGRRAARAAPRRSGRRPRASLSRRDKADDGAGQCRTQLAPSSRARHGRGVDHGRRQRGRPETCWPSTSKWTSSNRPPFRSWSRACGAWGSSRQRS